MNQGESFVCPKMLAITKRAKICQNCQICWADFVLTNLTEIHQNLSAILISLWQVWLKCGEIVKLWTFNWFDKVLSNMPFSLLHTFLDIIKWKCCNLLLNTYLNNSRNNVNSAGTIYVSFIMVFHGIFSFWPLIVF